MLLEDGEKVTLRREGFQPMTIRRNGDEYEYLSYTDRYGHETWSPITGFTNEQIESQIVSWREE